MQTAGSGPDSPPTAILATLPVIASGHAGKLGSNGTKQTVPEIPQAPLPGFAQLSASLESTD